MCPSHLKVVKGVMQLKTWENGQFWEVCDLVHTQKNELSQSKHMGLTIYTKGNINLASYAMGRIMLMWALEGGTCFGA